MANAIYPKYKEALLNGSANTDMSAGAVKAILVDLADYTYSAAHEFLSDVPAAARVAISGALTGKSFVDGKFDTADVTFSGVTGDTAEAIILFIDTGVEGTSRLVCFRDTGLTGMPVTPNSGDISHSDGTAGWFTI